MEPAKLFTRAGGLNEEMPLRTTKEVDLPSGHKGSVELTNQYVKLVGTNIPTNMDTSTREVDMLRNKNIMNGNDKSTKKSRFDGGKWITRS